MARVFITGSADGLGRAAAQRLLDDGDHQRRGEPGTQRPRPAVPRPTARRPSRYAPYAWAHAIGLSKRHDPAVVPVLVRPSVARYTGRHRTAAPPRDGRLPAGPQPRERVVVRCRCFWTIRTSWKFFTLVSQLRCTNASLPGECPPASPREGRAEPQSGYALLRFRPPFSNPVITLILTLIL